MVGTVSTLITLCRSDFSVSILWALAASATEMVKTMVFCMPKVPPISALLQKGARWAPQQPTPLGIGPDQDYEATTGGDCLRQCLGVQSPYEDASHDLDCVAVDLVADWTLRARRHISFIRSCRSEEHTSELQSLR